MAKRRKRVFKLTKPERIKLAKAISKKLTYMEKATTGKGAKLKPDGYDPVLGEMIVEEMLIRHGISVYGWSSSSCGRARWTERCIKIPKPTNSDRFAVCMHEIKHILDGKKGLRFQQEFWCDLYGREELIKLGVDTTDWDRRTNWHVLSRIAMAHNRGLQPDKIQKEIRDYFSWVDFDEWIGNTVFVQSHWHDKAHKLGYSLRLRPAMSKADIDAALLKKGLKMHRSDRDDSTYGQYQVYKINSTDKFSIAMVELNNLGDVVEEFELKPKYREV